MKLLRTYFFRSDSDPDKLYQTLEYDNGETSCDCKGWTRRNPPGGRTCKHTRLVNAKLAGKDAVRIAHHARTGPGAIVSYDDLYDADVRAAMGSKLGSKPAAKAPVRFGQIGRRKFAV